MTNNENMQNSFELCRKADALLGQNGLTIWGKKKVEDGYCQDRFEQRVQLGAYSRNSERRK